MAWRHRRCSGVAQKSLILTSTPPMIFGTRQGMRFRTLVLLLGWLLVTHAGELKADVDFTNYDQPVYEQIVNRIKAKVSARLGAGANTRDRYFIIPFAYENKENEPEYSHSFMTVIHVLPDDQQPRLTQGLKLRKYKNREFEAFTISWLPHDFAKNPNLCVFSGFGARLIPEANKCAPTIGRSFTLEETIKLGANVKNAIAMWGPYEMNKAGFDLVVKRKHLLDGGSIKYLADDRLTRKERVAINCFHAIAGLDKLYPNGGLFGTGFMMWGLNGTARVLIEYNDRAKEKGVLLEPIDVKNDRYGFVYAPKREERGIYNPVKNASAYHR
jgi:hypothetical protein